MIFMETDNIFKYRADLQLFAENILLSNYPHYFDKSGGKQRWHNKDLLTLAWDSFSKETLKKFESFAGGKADPCLFLYYLLMGLRKIDPELFPPHDITMLLANLIQAQYPPSSVCVYSGDLLAAGILLLSKGWNLRVGRMKWEPQVKLLREMMPEAKIDHLFLDKEVDVLLATSSHFMHRARREHEIRDIAETYFLLDTWDFLGVRSNEYLRRSWLERNALFGVIQLPRLKRQGWNYYSAILQYNQNSASQIRMVNLESADSGEAMLDQQLAISLMLNPPDNKSSVDVSISELKQDPICNLTPSIWLRKRNLPEVRGLRLGEYAQIIRCQLPRKKFKESEPLEYGMSEDGSSIVREVGMAALEPESGFLLPESGDQVSISFKSEAIESKYRLKENDIIFSFRGTQESLGRVGFVDQEPEMTTITGPAFCIIRTLGKVDPKWLYWALQTDEVRANILSRSSGKSLLNISTNDIKDLMIRLPEESREENSILDLHEEISKEIAVISQAMSKLGKNTKLIKRRMNAKKLISNEE